jgi:hypothetical protein
MIYRQDFTLPAELMEDAELGSSRSFQTRLPACD